MKLLCTKRASLSGVGAAINQKGPRIHNPIHSNKITSSYMTIKSTSWFLGYIKQIFLMLGVVNYDILILNLKFLTEKDKIF